MPGTKRHGDRYGARHLIGLSVAIGRFVEALFWAIMRVAGGITLVVITVLTATIMSLIAIRKLLNLRDRG